MSTQFTKLKEELDAKQHEVQQEQGTLDSIEKLTKELEAQKQALETQAAEVINRQKEVRIIQKRLDALAAVESAVDTAIHTKSSTVDAVKHVVETAIQSDQMTANEIVQTTLKTAMRVNGRSRSANLEDFFVDLVDDEKSLEVAIETAMENFADVNDVVVSTLAVALSKGWAIPALRASVLRVVNAMLPPRTSNVGPLKM